MATTLRRDLLQKSKSQLIKQCKTNNLSADGTKLQMINRLIAHLHTTPIKKPSSRSSKPPQIYTPNPLLQSMPITLALSSTINDPNDQILDENMDLVQMNLQKFNRKQSVQSKRKSIGKVSKQRSNSLSSPLQSSKRKSSSSSTAHMGPNQAKPKRNRRSTHSRTLSLKSNGSSSALADAKLFTLTPTDSSNDCRIDRERLLQQLRQRKSSVSSAKKYKFGGCKSKAKRSKTPTPNPTKLKRATPTKQNQSAKKPTNSNKKIEQWHKQRRQRKSRTQSMEIRQKTMLKLNQMRNINDCVNGNAVARATKKSNSMSLAKQRRHKKNASVAYRPYIDQGSHVNSYQPFSGLSQ